MPTFDLKCPSCGAVFQAEEEWIGETGECADCGGEILIRKTLSLNNPFQPGKQQVADEGKPLSSSPQALSDAQSVSAVEMKDRVRGFFVDVTEDRITKFRHAKTKTVIRMEEILDVYSVLDMGIVYVKKNDVGSVFFSFAYSRDCDNEISDTCINLKMSLVLDDDKIIELSDASGWESDFSLGEKGHLVIEKIQLSVSLQDMADIAKSRKMEYRIKTDNRVINGKLSDYPGNQLLILKGFYNNIFDEEFELEYLYKAIGKS